MAWINNIITRNVSTLHHRCVQGHLCRLAVEVMTSLSPSFGQLPIFKEQSPDLVGSCHCYPQHVTFISTYTHTQKWISGSRDLWDISIMLYCDVPQLWFLGDVDISVFLLSLKNSSLEGSGSSRFGRCHLQGALQGQCRVDMDRSSICFICLFLNVQACRGGQLEDCQIHYHPRQVRNSLGVAVVHHSSNSRNFSWSCIRTAKHQYSSADWMQADRGSRLHSNRIRWGRLNGLITLWSCTLNMLTFPLTCLVTAESRPQAFLWDAEQHSIPAIDRLSLPQLAELWPEKWTDPTKSICREEGEGAGGGGRGGRRAAGATSLLEGLSIVLESTERNKIYRSGGRVKAQWEKRELEHPPAVPRVTSQGELMGCSGPGAPPSLSVPCSPVPASVLTFPADRSIW